MEKRQSRIDEEVRLKNWTAVLNPIRFREVFLPETLGPLSREEEGLGVSPEEFKDIDKFLQSLEEKKTMRGV